MALRLPHFFTAVFALICVCGAAVPSEAAFMVPTTASTLSATGGAVMVAHRHRRTVVRPVVVVRPHRHRPHYGRVISGVALGVVVGAAIAGSPPSPPAPNLCWYWSDNYRQQGYWDYCR